jgi:hypothetical protein
MTNPTPKKLTRRDAIKILGAAAGASVLANLPSKWSTPELTQGVLPAHAQTSICSGTQLLLEPASATPALSTSGSSAPPDAGGSTFLSWDCSHSCLYVEVSIGVGSQLITVTPFNQASFDVSINAGDFWSIYLDVNSGLYTTATNSVALPPPGSGCPPIT